MTRPWTTLTLALALPALLTACGGHATPGSSASTAAGVTSQAVSFRTIAQGDDTAYRGTPPDAQSSVEADDLQSWTTLWGQHVANRTSPSPVPQVDFTRERVLALFLGERKTSGYGIQVVGVAAVASQGRTVLEVDYTVTRPTGAVVSGTRAPYHFVAISERTLPIVLQDVTPTPPTTPLTDVHGALVEVPAASGPGQVLAFLPDGRTAPLEVVDPRPLQAASACAGWSLDVTGDDEPNTGGSSGLARAVRIASFDLDTVFTTGRLSGSGGAVLLKDVRGQSYTPTGPLAQALLAAPQGHPIHVTGWIDTRVVPPTPSKALRVSSWRPAIEVGYQNLRPLIGFTDFSIDDLDTGAYRISSNTVMPVGGAYAGRGRQLDPQALVHLRALITAAHLATQPTMFRPNPMYPDDPSTTLTYADATHDLSITIMGGATGVPPAVDAVLTALRSLGAAVPVLRGLEQGQHSRFLQPWVHVARTAQDWTALYAHGGGGNTIPVVDFTHEVVVGAFMGQEPTGGYAIKLSDLERIGSAVYVTVTRTRPTGLVPMIVTSPYDYAAVRDAQGDIYVDGVKQ